MTSSWFRDLPASLDWVHSFFNTYLVLYISDFGGNFRSGNLRAIAKSARTSAGKVYTGNGVGGYFLEEYGCRLRV